jgi:hypothetical protein
MDYCYKRAITLDRAIKDKIKDIPWFESPSYLKPLYHSLQAVIK